MQKSIVYFSLVLKSMLERLSYIFFLKENYFIYFLGFLSLFELKYLISWWLELRFLAFLMSIVSFDRIPLVLLLLLELLILSWKLDLSRCSLDPFRLILGLYYCFFWEVARLTSSRIYLMPSSFLGLMWAWSWRDEALFYLILKDLEELSCLFRLLVLFSRRTDFVFFLFWNIFEKLTSISAIYGERVAYFLSAGVFEWELAEFRGISYVVPKLLYINW